MYIRLEGGRRVFRVAFRLTTANLKQLWKSTFCSFENCSYRVANLYLNMQPIANHDSRPPHQH